MSQRTGVARTWSVEDASKRSDEELLRATAQEPEAFGVFYRRHVDAVLRYVLSRTRRPELAADVTAETFAAALEQHDRFDPRRGPARAWLLVMANSRMLDGARRGRVEERARRRLGMPLRVLDDAALEALEDRLDAAQFDVARLVDDLPAEQRAAVLARVVDGREYAEIAASQAITPVAARQRVSRGLQSLRTRARPQEDA